MHFVAFNFFFGALCAAPSIVGFVSNAPCAAASPAAITSETVSFVTTAPYTRESYDFSSGRASVAWAHGVRILRGAAGRSITPGVRPNTEAYFIAELALFALIVQALCLYIFNRRHRVAF